MIVPVRLGIADHLGWAVAVTATDDHEVVDRRRVELAEPGVPTTMPIHSESSSSLDLDEIAALVAEVRAAAARATAASLEQLATDLPEPIRSISIRDWPSDFPTDIETLRRSPYEAWADGVMYRQVLCDVARERGWDIHLYDAKEVVGLVVDMLGGEQADEVLLGPRARLGPPWAKDHRVALAATIEAARIA